MKSVCRSSVSDNPEFLDPLTPNRLGGASPAPPFTPDAQQYTDLQRVLRSSQTPVDTIQSRWNRDYFHLWNEKSKWNKEGVIQLEVNDLVLMVDEIYETSTLP